MVEAKFIFPHAARLVNAPSRWVGIENVPAPLTTWSAIAEGFDMRLRGETSSMVRRRGIRPWLRRVVLPWALWVGMGVLLADVAAGMVFSVVARGKSVVRVKVGRLFQDSQTRGFFRIGILPCWVAEPVEIECRDASHLEQVLGSLGPSSVTASSGRSFEFRRMSLAMAEDHAPRLRAARVRFRASGEWELSDGVSWQVPGGAAGEAGAAILRVSGPDAGWLEGQIGTNRFRVPLLGEFRSELESSEVHSP